MPNGLAGVLADYGRMSGGFLRNRTHSHRRLSYMAKSRIPKSKRARGATSEAGTPNLLLGDGVQDNPIDLEASRRLGLLTLSILALALGVVTGFGAVIFRDLIGLLHNLFFSGRSSFATTPMCSPHRAAGVRLVILAPVVGAIIVTFLVNNFAPEAKGHGVPEVMDAIYYREGVIRPIVAVVKSLASAVAIGSGSSVGREGPIIQIGSALGSTLGQIIRMPPGQRIALVAAGAGAGIAATFNTPIGGVMFAIELMMPEVSVSTFLPVRDRNRRGDFRGTLVFWRSSRPFSCRRCSR